MLSTGDFYEVDLRLEVHPDELGASAVQRWPAAPDYPAIPGSVRSTESANRVRSATDKTEAEGCTTSLDNPYSAGRSLRDFSISWDAPPAFPAAMVPHLRQRRTGLPSRPAAIRTFLSILCRGCARRLHPGNGSSRLL